MKIEKLLPNLFILGAQKSGTTSLHGYLSQHPEIFMSYPMKEPGYFLDFDVIRKYWGTLNIKLTSKVDLLKNHMLQGYHGEKYIGEGSIYYTLGKRAELQNFPEKIFKNCPKAKFIYILRNPLARIVSAFLHEKKKNRAEYNLNEFVTNSENKVLDHVCVETSLYHYQLSQYLKYYDKCNFKIIIFEDFIRNPQWVLDEICSFLKVERLNKFDSLEVLNQSYIRSTILKQDLKFSEAVYHYLMDLIIPDKTSLENFIGKSIQKWDLSKELWCNQR